MSSREKVANMLGALIVNAKGGDTDKLVTTISDQRYLDSAAQLTAYVLKYKTRKPEMVDSVREIMEQNGFNTNMVGAIDFVTNHSLLMRFIGKRPKLVILILKLRHSPENLITFLKKHLELFDLLVLISKKMPRITLWYNTGDDLSY